MICPALHYAQTLHTLIGFKVYLYNFQFGPVLIDLAVEAGLTNPVYKESHHWASHGSSIPFLFHNLCRKCHHRGCAAQKVRALARSFGPVSFLQPQFRIRKGSVVFAHFALTGEPLVWERTASTTDVPILPSSSILLLQLLGSSAPSLHPCVNGQWDETQIFSRCNRVEFRSTL